MLYICIFSNKFDLKQTIRVLHTGGQRFDGPRSVTKYDKKWIKSFTDWQHKKNCYYDITFWKNGGVRKYDEEWRATGTRICVFTVSASTTNRKIAEPESRMDNTVSRKKILAKTIHGRKRCSRTRTGFANLSTQELRHTSARKQISADPDHPQLMPGLINDM